MHENKAPTPKQTADDLLRRHGNLATLKASVKAYDAVLKKDVSDCLFWNQVLKILNADDSPTKRLNGKHLA